MHSDTKLQWYQFLLSVFEGSYQSKLALDKKGLTHKKSLEPETKDVLKENLVDPETVLLPLLHIKLEPSMQFVKALPQQEESYKYLCEKFPLISGAKLREGFFVDPDIQKLMTLN